MKRIAGASLILLGVVWLIGVVWPAAAAAQAPVATQHIVGDRIGGNMQFDPKAGTVVETATLTFQGPGRSPVYTIDFTTFHPVGEPVASPGVVDIVVTQHPVEDDTPEMMLRVDGATMPLVTRLHSRRSVVATVSLAELDRITSAGVVVDSTFGTELELGAGQVRMLRATADRWLGR
jgi:hypothetical protein